MWNNERWRWHFVSANWHLYSENVWRCSGETDNRFIWKRCHKLSVHTALPQWYISNWWIRHTVIYSNGTSLEKCSWCFLSMDWGIITDSQKLLCAKAHTNTLWAIMMHAGLSDRALIIFIFYNNQMMTLFLHIEWTLPFNMEEQSNILCGSLCVPERPAVWLKHPASSRLILRSTVSINGAPSMLWESALVFHSCS